MKDNGLTKYCRCRFNHKLQIGYGLVVESSLVFPVQATWFPQQKAYAQNDEAFRILGRKQGSSKVLLYKDLEIEKYSKDGK